MIGPIKLKGGALYIAIIISILISVVLTLFIVLAYHNIQSIQVQSSISQLELSLESGFELSKSSNFAKENQNHWQKLPYNNDSIIIKKLPWGCFQLISVSTKNAHHHLHKTGLFGEAATIDTALMVSDHDKPIGLAGEIKFLGMCYLPKAGIKTAYIEGTSFSNLNSLRPYIKLAPNTIPAIDETFLKDIAFTQSELNQQNDSIIDFIPDILNNSFKQKTLVIQQGSISLNNQTLSNNIKLIAANTIIIDNACQLTNILLIARKIIFKKGFKGIVHAVAKDSIVVENECEFNYPSSFCTYNSNTGVSGNNIIKGILFGEACKFRGSIIAANNKESSYKSMIKFNKQFQLIGNAYSSNYCNIQGNIYGTIICSSVLLQTPSAVYENHLLNCSFDPKKYGSHLVVADWFTNKHKQYVCAKWF